MPGLQNQNILNWVEAMLSGKYKHCKGMLYNVKTDCYCALGVAATILGRELSEDYQANDSWFARAFGLPRPPEFYAAVSDKSDHFFGVCALLLKELPDDLKRKKELNAQVLLGVQQHFSATMQGSNYAHR